MSMINPNRIYPPVTNIERLPEIVELLRESELFGLFSRGVGMGLEGVMWTDSHSDPHLPLKSPLTVVIETPAWEGSHRGRHNEHDFVYSLGVLVGAFAGRQGIDIEQLMHPAITEGSIL